jgi:hypothetical protein
MAQQNFPQTKPERGGLKKLFLGGTGLILVLILISLTTATLFPSQVTPFIDWVDGTVLSPVSNLVTEYSKPSGFIIEPGTERRIGETLLKIEKFKPRGSACRSTHWDFKPFYHVVKAAEDPRYQLPDIESQLASEDVTSRDVAQFVAYLDVCVENIKKHREIDAQLHELVCLFKEDPERVFILNILWTGTKPYYQGHSGFDYSKTDLVQVVELFHTRDKKALEALAEAQTLQDELKLVFETYEFKKICEVGWGGKPVEKPLSVIELNRLSHLRSTK